MSKPTPLFSPKRIILLQGSLACAFMLAVVAQARVHLFQRNQILELAEDSKRFTGDVVEEARRGSIYTADGKPLAQDDDTYLLRFSFASIPKSPAFLIELGGAAGIPAGELQQLAASGTKYVEWQDRIHADRADRIERVRRKWRVDGVSLARPGVRSYPMGEVAACLVGLVQNHGGVSGLELGKQKELAGTDGRIIGLRDRAGNFLPTRLSPDSKDRIDGSDIVLTIDSDLQTAATEAVKRAVETQKAHSGSAIVADPTTGEILAMANWPSFDPNRLPRFTQEVKEATGMNPCTMSALEPGSTFKVLTLAGVLDAGKWGEDQQSVCTGRITVEHSSFGCDKSHNNGVHGPLSPERAIAVSCNVTASRWAMSVGYEPFLIYLKRLGLLSRPNLGLPRESKGIFKRDKDTPTLQLALMGFGQAIGVTPVALANAFSMLGNHGVRMKPMLIKRIGDRTFQPTEAGQMVRPEVADRVLEYMESVFYDEHGTAKGLKIPGYRLAGKTGTAQKRGSGGGHVSNFVGFVPAKSPKAVILVMVDDPQGLYYGAAVAGPAFKEIAEAVIRRYNLPPTEPK